MIQKEVAERLSAEEGEINLLAAAVQFWAEPKILFTLKPSDFNPPPKVESAVVRLTPKAITENQDEATEYYRLIKAVFKQPRKTLINNLKEGTDLSRTEIESALLELKIDQKSRPQDLNIEKIKKLARIINK
jgi:16S rRNA (adenine1518-N6/adenine1519-N6)-dimethyltransferase